MKEVKKGVFEFESTKRSFHASMDGISLTKDGMLQYGSDGYVEIIGDEGLPDCDLEFTDCEKKELAMYVIDKWVRWAGL